MREPREERRRRSGKNNRLVHIFAAVIVAGALLAFPLFYNAQTPDEENTSAPQPEAMEQPVSLQISCVGDVMVHLSQIASQYDSGADVYDYNNNFEYVKKYIEQADLALCNLETTFAGKPYTGYPVFSAPDELGAALKNTGFDVAITSNNHMLDRGVIGLKRTLDVLRANGFVTAGSRMSTEEPKYAITEVKGVKVGIVAYTYQTPSNGGYVAINGTAISQEAASLINSFRQENMDEALIGIGETVDAARTAGAELIILYYHWGQEYQLKANEWQRTMAQKSIDRLSVDMIFASHPHTPQEAELMMNAEGKQVPVFFSMGNFISNQRAETLDNRYTEIGMIAQVDLEYMVSEQKITSIQMNAIPTWVEKYKSKGKDVYAIIPLDDDLDANQSLAVSGHLNRAKKAWEDANGIFGID